MAILIGVFAVVLFSLLESAAAVPSPQSMNSDLTILTHNDLYGSSSPRDNAAIVLHKPLSFPNSLYGCAGLGEGLWDPSTSSRDLSFLRYLEYGKPKDGLGLYWIASSSGCLAIDTRGHTEEVDCSLALPALCSHSAPLSSPKSDDAARKWQTTVKTKDAEYLGYRDKLSFRFLGIKYASQTARFGYSSYSPPRGVNISALSYGPNCFQSGCGQAPDPVCSEDCLTLNIWTPHLPNGKSSNKRAVMVWIHGGGFTSGTGTDPTFDGGNMASRGDVVVVTINYRLSTLGFLAVDNTTLRGNYGLGDQITALDWIRAHIEDFGGNKNRITVFGQSAGAASVRALLASPQARGKFSGAILQSNPAGAGYASTFSRYLSLEEAIERTKAILKDTGCTQVDKAIQLACLRAQDPRVLQGYRNGSYTGTVARYPVVDGTYLTSNELTLGESATKINVTLMTGVMRDDGGPFSSFSKNLDPSRTLSDQGFNSKDILDSGKFPVSESGNRTIDVFNLTARVATDAMFRCLGQSTALTASEKGIFPVVYAYEFDRAYQISEWNPNPPTCEPPATPERPHGDVGQPYFKCHSGDLYYVFGTLLRQGRPARDEDDIPFSQYIVDTWTAFAREKDPNPDLEYLRARGYTNTSAAVGRSPPWNPVQSGKPSLRILDTTATHVWWREVEQCAVVRFPIDYYSK